MQPARRAEPKSGTAGRRFVAGAMPLVGAVLAAGALALFAIDRRLDRAAARSADRLTSGLVPWQRALGELDRAVAELALASALTHDPPSSDDRPRLAAASRHLHRALDEGEPYAQNVRGAAWRSARAELADFERRALDHGGHPARHETLPRDAEAAFAALRVQAAAAGDEALVTLDDFSRGRHAGAWVDLQVMALVAAAALLALALAARREKLACRREAELMARLAQRNADLDAFAGRLAHDLRNPLSPILLGIQRIERADVPPDVRDLATGVERSARRLLNMIEVVLEFTRAAAPAVEIEPSDVAQVIDETLGFFHDRARSIGARFDVAVERGLCVRCEAAILSSVLQNLIENALKYGCDGASRAVFVRGRRDAARALIEVEDEGQGIPHELAERVFEPRFQERSGSSGLGLGLATVKRLLDGRSGSIEIARGSRGGALFRVRLAYAAPAASVGS